MDTSTSRRNVSVASVAPSSTSPLLSWISSRAITSIVETIPGDRGRPDAGKGNEAAAHEEHLQKRV